MLWQEVNLVVERENRRVATEATMQQLALRTIPNECIKPQSTKDAVKEFVKRVSRLIGD